MKQGNNPLFFYYKQLGIEQIECDVRKGTRRDAILHSVGANGKHGLRRTNEDKRKSALILLEDEEWGKWTNGEIARKCIVTAHFIGEVRKSVGINPSERTYIDKHGNISTINTANIGKSRNLPQAIEQPTHTEPQPVVEPQSESAWQPQDVEYFTENNKTPDESRVLTYKINV